MSGNWNIHRISPFKQFLFILEDGKKDVNEGRNSTENLFFFSEKEKREQKSQKFDRKLCKQRENPVRI